jgi:mono/diheme cytochrome c family protein
MNTPAANKRSGRRKKAVTGEAEMLRSSSPARGPGQGPHGKRGRRRSGIVPRLLIPILVIAAVAHATAAQAQGEEQAKAGLEIWKSSGCADCHGPFADGDKQRDEMPTGANLRGSRLDAAALKQTISCGRPDTGMPSFDAQAYTVHACYGQPLGTAPDNLYPAPRTLTQAQIDSVIAYLQAHVLGRRQITHEDCSYYYYDEPSSWCEDK